MIPNRLLQSKLREGSQHLVGEENEKNDAFNVVALSRLPI